MNQQTEVQKTGRICRAELNVMEVLWVQGKMPASRIYRILQDKIGWKKAQPRRCWVNVLKKALWDVQNRIISAMPCLVGKM